MIGRRRAAGFTLIELLVSLFVLGTVASMLMTGTGVMRQIIDRAANRGATNESVVTAQTILRNRIEAMVPSVRFDLGKPVADIRGSGTILSFFAPAAIADQPSSIRRYRLLRSASGQLVLYAVDDLAATVDPYGPGEIGWQPTVLLTGVRSIDFDYFGAAPPDEQRRWRSQWIGLNRPPELIRLRLAFEGGGARQWPDLIIKPGVTINSACKLDPNSGRCAGT